MNCTAVRDLLPEHALGVASADATAIDRHLATCAACRKEARDLEGAAATLAFALAPASPRRGLADDVTTAVQAAAGPPRRAPSARRTTTILLAAAVALAGLVGGAALARREPPAQTVAEQRADDTDDRIATFVQDAIDAEGVVASTGVLRHVGGAAGGGTVVSVVAPTTVDQVLVVVNGLPDDAVLPYSVELADGEGRFAPVGAAEVLDAGGGFTLATVTARDLSRFVNVLVRDARGDVVMRGTLREELPEPAPSPTAAG